MDCFALLNNYVIDFVILCAPARSYALRRATQITTIVKQPLKVSCIRHPYCSSYLSNFIFRKTLLHIEPTCQKIVSPIGSNYIFKHFNCKIT